MTASSVVISERAARRIGEILKVEGDGAMLRISVEGGGCSGFQYKFDIERAQAEDDLSNQSGNPSFRRFSAIRSRTADEKTIACLNFFTVRSG
jgi:Fe-S cluster assembly iron-binding protein IscA